MQTLLNYLVINNPMCLEGIRAGRRFLRTGGDTGRAVNITILSILGLIYVWVLLTILRYREDVSGALLFFELGILTLAVPASLFAAVSGEREKLTWDSLIMTRLTPAQIIAGKLLWRIGLVAGIMALFTIPLLLCQYGLGFWCGSGDNCRGVSALVRDYSPNDMLHAQATIFAWSLLLAALSFFVSTKTRRPVTSLSIIAVVLLSFVALVPILVIMFTGQTTWISGDTSMGHILGTFLVYMNPFIDMNNLGNHGNRNFGHDMWHTLGLSRAVPAIYGAGALALVIATYRSLRGLETPRRTIG